jgi:hypothetical protein
MEPYWPNFGGGIDSFGETMYLYQYMRLNGDRTEGRGALVTRRAARDEEDHGRR